MFVSARLDGMQMQIGPAAKALASTPRMLRYRESLGLLAPRRHGGGRRTYGERELRAAAYAAQLEQHYDVTPKALAFGLRVLAEPDVAADVRRLGVLSHRLTPTTIEALDFDAAKGRLLLRLTRPERASPTE